MMKTYSALKATLIGSAAAFLLSPAATLADVAQNDSAVGHGGHSLVHRVSNSLASEKVYSRGESSGYKWGRDMEPSSPSSEWTQTNRDQAGYKWGSTENSAKSGAQSFVNASTFQWGTQSFSEQSAFRWGVRSYADQTAFRWGVRSYIDQTAFRWGVR